MFSHNWPYGALFVFLSGESVYNSNELLHWFQPNFGQRSRSSNCAPEAKFAIHDGLFTAWSSLLWEDVGDVVCCAADWLEIERREADSGGQERFIADGKAAGRRQTTCQSRQVWPKPCLYRVRITIRLLFTPLPQWCVGSVTSGIFATLCFCLWVQVSALQKEKRLELPTPINLVYVQSVEGPLVDRDTLTLS